MRQLIYEYLLRLKTRNIKLNFPRGQLLQSHKVFSMCVTVMTFQKLIPLLE